MLLAVDVGNTNLTVGLFEGDRRSADWRLKTDLEQTVDGWAALFHNLLSLAGLTMADVTGFAFSSVVPQLESSVSGMARRYLNLEPFQVTAATPTGLKIRIDKPEEVGADRIVNSVAAAERHGCPCIAVDFGTAITFDAISANREYLGGIICPGIAVSSQALVRRTARLPQIDLRKPDAVIGTNTVGSLQSGFYYGMLGMIDGHIGLHARRSREGHRRGRDRGAGRHSLARLAVRPHGGRRADPRGAAAGLGTKPWLRRLGRRHPTGSPSPCSPTCTS